VVGRDAHRYAVEPRPRARPPLEVAQPPVRDEEHFLATIVDVGRGHAQPPEHAPHVGQQLFEQRRELDGRHAGEWGRTARFLIVRARARRTLRGVAVAAQDDGVRRAAVAALGFALVAPAVARTHADLVVEATGDAVGCTDAASLAAAVEQRLGRRAFAAGDSGTKLRVMLEGSPRRWLATVTERDGTATPAVRTVELAPGGCAEAREAVIVILTIALGTPSPPVAEPPAPPRPPRFALGAGLFAAGASLPGPAPEAIGRLAWLGRYGLRVELAAGATLATERTTDDGAGARFQAVTAALALCPPLAGDARSRATVHACGVVGLDRVRATGSGLDVARDAARWIPRAALGGAAAARLGAGFWARADVWLEAPLQRRSWVYGLPDGTTRTLWAPPLLAPAAALTLELQLR
jgi:hypothetical protein